MYRVQRGILIWIIVLLILVIGTFRHHVVADVPAKDAVTIYKVRGVLRSYDSQHAQATISHEAIPGYMSAMTMTYNARFPKEFASLHSNDILAFQLCVTQQDAWIEQVEKIGTDAPQPFAPAPAGYVRELTTGDALPDLELVDQHNEKIHLSDFRGQAVAITFIYTRCPLPTYCPLMTRNFQEAQDFLFKLGTGENWHFVTISFDPEHDTPEVLAAMAGNLGADAKHWSFATGSSDKIRALGRTVGLEFNLSAGGQIRHNLRTVVVDPSGRIAHIFQGNSWTPQDLAAEVGDAIHMRH